jgi:hypothetical protein
MIQYVHSTTPIEAPLLASQVTLPLSPSIKLSLAKLQGQLQSGSVSGGVNHWLVAATFNIDRRKGDKGAARLKFAVPTDEVGSSP